MKHFLIIFRLVPSPIIIEILSKAAVGSNYKDPHGNIRQSSGNLAKEGVREFKSLRVQGHQILSHGVKLVDRDSQRLKLQSQILHESELVLLHICYGFRACSFCGTPNCRIMYVYVCVGGGV